MSVPLLGSVCYRGYRHGKIQYSVGHSRVALDKRRRNNHHVDAKSFVVVVELLD